ncbi:BTAD domain-containing putative transcriptional regulator [Streptomyces sp. NPDC096013]|uniref:BTAD domain-containing putative transcriptional regulator n=1 Tax=Streptomyces sp. NPDC096013 TaxID=3366069 RepID=UPI00380D8B1A
MSDLFKGVTLERATDRKATTDGRPRVDGTVETGVPAWELRVFGSLTALHAGRSLPLGPLRHRALLGLLLVRLGNVVAAGQLVDELWSGRPPRRPIATLQTYVSHLRRALASGGEQGGARARVRHSSPGYVLEIDPELVDVHRFETLVDRGRQDLAERRFHSARDELSRALALWRGDPYLELTSYGPIADENERLEQLRLTAVETRAGACLAIGEADSVVTALYPEVQRYPTRERCVGHLMSGLYLLGRQAESLRLYEQTRRHLADELGVDPGAELQGVHSDILHQRLPLAEPPVSGGSRIITDRGPDPRGPAPEAAPRPPAAMPGPDDSPTAVPERPSGPPQSAARARGAAGTRPPRLRKGARTRGVFVGRDRELAVLGDHVLDALDGGSHLTAVLGEMGVGKTELVEELAVRLHELLQEVVWGRCTSGEGVPAYWVWAQVFRQLAVSRPEAFRKAEARFGSLLAPLMLDPESGRRSLSGEDPSARARFLTQDAMCETLLSLAAEDPLVVVLEDLDQADESSLELLALLRTRLHCEPLSLVVTADDTGAAADLMGGGAVAEALGDSRTRSVRLTGLTRRETGDLVSAQCAVEVPDDVLRLLHERSRGNPYVLHQFIAGVGDPGLLCDRAVVENALADIPVGVRQSLGRRLAALPGPVLDVLRCCSALGGAFELALVREVLGAGGMDVEAAVEAATRRGLLRREAQPPFLLSFRDELVQEVLLGELSGSDRARLRESVVRALAQRPAALHGEYEPGRERTRRTPRRRAKTGEASGACGPTSVPPHPA